MAGVADKRQAIDKIRLLEWHLNLTDGDEWLDNTDVCLRLNISKRTLQNYRDTGIIFYTSIGGIFLYPEEGIRKVLEENYYKPSFCKL